MNALSRTLSLICLIAWISVVGNAPTLAADATLTPSDLRCEYLINPLGVGETAPRLSWILQSSRQTDHQAAYRLLVASTSQLLAADQGDLWDSGKVESDENAFVVYSGKPLQSRAECFWKVQVWSALGGDPQWSQTASWTMGLLKPEDWSGKWIDSRDAFERSPAAHRLKILHATYGAIAAATAPAPSTAPAAATAPVVTDVVDVTQRLQGMVDDGGLDVVVNNDSFGGDPALNRRKQLKVEYELDGRTIQRTLAEKRKLSIPPAAEPVWCLRKQFTAKGPIGRATLYVTALGLYQMHINGQRVGDHVLAPDWTDYNKRVRYQAYDVTSLLKPGENAMASLVANGWYAGHVGNGGLHQWGKTPALMGQLEITYADGSTDRIVTDTSWQTRPSPILSSDFMLGETYDARQDIADWDQPGLSENENGWEPASTRDEIARSIDWQVDPPVRQTGEITPVNLTEPAPGHWTFDLGQNMVGVVRLKMSAPAGTVITLHHAEMLKPDGTIYTANLRGAPSVDTYTCKGGGVEIWQPQFTFHGFRYVQLTGLSDKPSMDTITGVVLGSDTPRSGSFSCSDSRINQLMSNIQWGQRGNYLSVPTDCPQRDERLGWMGDAEVFVRTATCNADVASFFTKWLVDVDDAQSQAGAFSDVSPRRAGSEGTPAWADAGVICPWTIYLAYGDKRLLQRNLPAMTKWIDWCKAHSDDLIRDDASSRGGDYGDWLSIKADTPKDLIGTAYFAYSTQLLAKAYAAVGDTENAAKYQKLFEDIRSAFDKKYVTADGRITGDTQCCYAMALKFDLLPDNLRPLAAKYLTDDVRAKDWHLSTGFVGVSYLLPTLTASGNLDTAYKLLMQDTFPSWLFSVKHGATTIWERWDGWTPEQGFQSPTMNSFNHYSLGSVGEWLYDTVGGIAWDPEHPGYKHVIIHPQPGDGLTWAKASVGSMYGNISTDWTASDGKFELKVTIPPNVTATVYVPVAAGESVEPFDPQGVQVLPSAEGSNLYEVQSGTYLFSVTRAGK